MMRLAINKSFADEKITSIIIDPLETNKGAIRFYEKIGFNPHYAIELCDESHKMLLVRCSHRYLVTSQ